MFSQLQHGSICWCKQYHQLAPPGDRRQLLLDGFTVALRIDEPLGDFSPPILDKRVPIGAHALDLSTEIRKLGPVRRQLFLDRQALLLGLK